MNPPRSFVGTAAGLHIFRSLRWRATIFSVLIAISAVLAFFPERYRAAVTLTPTDPDALGLSGTLGQLGAINSVFGNQTAVEIAQRVANSQQVRNLVIDRTNLQKRLSDLDRTELHRWLYDNVSARTLRGGIIQVEMKIRDGQLARAIVAAYAAATQERLGEISRTQTAYKRQVLVQLVADASASLAKAQARYDEFRLRNSAPSPESEIENVSLRIPELEGAIKAKEIAIASAQTLFTENNRVMRQMQAELAATQQQLALVKTTNANQEATVGRAVANSSQLFKLQRELVIQRSLYDSYLRFLQGTAVENLTSTANVRILEPPFIDSERQYWWPAVASCIALILLWGAIEFYRLRPPAGSRLAGDES